MNTKGFTLIEFVIIILVLGVVIATLIPRAGNLVDNARISAAETEMTELMRAIIGDVDSGFSGFMQHMGRPPADSAGKRLIELYSDVDTVGFNPVTNTGWGGPYIGEDDNGNGTISAAEAADELTDPWDNSYVYSLTEVVAAKTVTVTITITSYGKNGASGGGDDIVEEAITVHTHTL